MKKWDCWQEAKGRLKFLEDKNPLLSFLLHSHDDVYDSSLQQKVVQFDEGCDVIFIEGVWDIDLSEALKCGKKVVFVEKELPKIRSFIMKSDLIEHPSVEIVSHLDEELKRCAWKYLFAECQFVGEVPLLRKWLDGVHLLASDTHQNKVIAKNIQSNILRSYEFIDGKSLENAYSGTTAIVCGSGQSLDDEAIAQIRALEGHALVIAAGSAMPKLERLGVRIDFGVYVDPEPPLAQYRQMSSFDFPLFYQNRMCEKLFSMHKGDKIWMGVSGGWRLDEKLMIAADVVPWEIDSGWNAGTFGVQIASFLGCKKIVMVGMDNSMPNDRDLQPGEVIVEDMITRKDLVHAREWLTSFVKSHLDIDFIMPDRGLVVEGALRENQWTKEVIKKIIFSQTFKRSDLNFVNVAQLVGEINSSALVESIDSFLNALREGVDSEGFAREKILLEVDLGESILVEYVLKDMWEVTRHLFAREEEKLKLDVENEEVKELILKATFFKEAAKETICNDTFLLTGLSQGICFCGMLEGEVRRSYPNGRVCSIEYYREGKRHGKWLRMFESGDLMSEVHYFRGVLHGSFKLWGDRGLKREGLYWYGRKDGRHLVYHSGGTLLFESQYDKGEPISQHNTYSSLGHIVEKLIYKSPKKFDRYCYNERGDLTYQGVFNEDVFEEVHLDEYGQKVSGRTGKWVEEALVWD